IWNWAKEKNSLKAENFLDEQKLVLEKIEELIGIPQSTINLFEELYENIKKNTSVDEANKIIIELYDSIKIGENLSVFTPKYQYWLLTEYLLPMIDKINDPSVDELKKYIKLVSEFILYYLSNKFESIAKVEKIKNYIRDCGF